MRNTSPTFRQAVNARETPEAVLILLTLDNADLDEPTRVTSDAVNTISNGQTFIPCPFRITLPDDTEEHVTEARLTIDNVDREIVLALRKINSPLSLTIQIQEFKDSRLRHSKIKN